MLAYNLIGMYFVNLEALKLCDIW